ncbi:type III secretion system chaperone family protein [Paenirhodobacter enshiensis]|uniref:Diacylglyceryl transferase n=1 Tax=Paenirhodobacter enshiensis TaxID=1105367 RepID=A0A086Y757_9RHOB|nr:YbjN domain-containing protein [Paenirhodobacter enshiensis]KFI30107.1 diacylglyceryl transferase [Paenirhodobacter enshiensis]
MAATEDYLEVGDLHPIDVVEDLAQAHEWDFDRVADDQIAMMVEGQWRTYSITLAWSEQDETLRLISTFELDAPAERHGAFYDLLNRINDQCWMGAFALWPDQKMMVWRNGLCLAGGQCASTEQVDRMIGAAVVAAERFYPAMQLVCWAGETPAQAMKVAIAEAYGRA